MLKKVLAISGRPGLFMLINQGKNCLIVESLSEDKKRLPVFNNEKVMSLGDIAMYTVDMEKPLGRVFDDIYKEFEGKEIDIKELEKNGTLRGAFKKILPDYDEDRVRVSDMKKAFSWYNILVKAGFDHFMEEEENEPEAENPEVEEKK